MTDAAATAAAATDAATSPVPAPPLDPDLPTSFADATRFLYTGDDPLQRVARDGDCRPRAPPFVGDSPDRPVERARVGLRALAVLASGHERVRQRDRDRHVTASARYHELGVLRGPLTPSPLSFA